MEILIGLFSILLFLAPLILVIVNASKVSSLTRRLQQVEFTLLQLRNELESLRKGKPQEKPVPDIAPERKHEPAPEITTKPPPVPLHVRQPQPPVVPAQEPSESIPPRISEPIFQSSARQIRKEGRTSKEWEALIGGKVLNRIGALALIIGVGFFLKYAFDNNWISESVRVLMGAMAGGGLLFFAMRMHKKGFEVFSQGLVGAGVSILYLSVYAAYNFYHLVPQVVAFVLMAIVTMVTLWQSLKYDSLAVALLGWAGGFLTPFMLSAGAGNEIGLFTYIALLTAGLLSIVISKEKWIVIEPLTMAGTYFIYFLWFDSVFKPELLTPAVFFLTLFWILFLGFEAFRNLNKNEAWSALRHILAVVNGVLYYIGMYHLLEPDYHAWMGLTTFLIALPYFGLFLILKNGGEATQDLLDRYVLGAIVLVFSATAIQFSGFMTVILWSLEVLIVVYAGTKSGMKSLWAAAVVLFSITMFKLFLSDGSFTHIPLEEFRLLFTMRAAAFLALGAALFVASEIFRKREESLARRIGSGLSYAWCVVFFVFLSSETINLFDRWMLYVEGAARESLLFKEDLTLALVWTAYSIILTWFGFRRSSRPVLHAGIGLMVLGLAAGLFRSLWFEPIEWFSLLFNVRVFVLCLLLVGAIVQQRLWKSGSKEGNWTRTVAAIFGLTIVALVLVLLTSETRDFFQKEIRVLQLQMGDNWTKDFEAQLSNLRNMQSLSLSGVWLVYSVILMVVGIWKRYRNLRLVAIGLFGVAILKIFIYDLSFLQTLYRIFSFIGLGVILLGVSYLYQKYKSIILEGEAPGVSPIP
ncbi:MAG: DUF2339 domain-containing protein [Bacteroidetes bacterium]|nr:DUF2339 domain-containing protein [Bacteroidota bacterium]MCW5896075.1 DUF2339 domain-containing protein [Bacteroidota bacterium]